MDSQRYSIFPTRSQGNPHRQPYVEDEQSAPGNQHELGTGLRGYWIRAKQTWQGLDVKVRAGWYIVIAFGIMIGLPAATAEVLHRTNPGVSLDAQQNISVYNTNTGNVVTIPLNEYVENVLAAQMSPSSPMSALEAAAVVIRTYAERSIQASTGPVDSSGVQSGQIDPESSAPPAPGTGTTKSSATAATGTGTTKSSAPPATGTGTTKSSATAATAADVTTSATTDLAWLTDSQQQSTFGANYTGYVARLDQAVHDTDGIILTYQQQPIVALFSQESGGVTRSSAATFGKQLPYLTVVKCPADAADPHLTQTSTFTQQQLAIRLGLTPQSVSMGDFQVTRRDGEGYALQITDGSHGWTGQEFVEDLGLPSADMAISAHHSNLVITTQGRGTGFGMSLHQAVAWAASGTSWQTILHRFYPGTRIQLAVP